MKTLKESLFDTDLDKKDILLGDMYELSDVAHRNVVSNSLSKLLDHFDRKKLARQAKTCKIKPNLSNYFIKNNTQYDKQIVDLITVLLNAPYQIVTCNINHVRSFVYECVPELNDYFSNILKSKNIEFWVNTIGVCKNGMPETVGIIIYTDIMSSTPNRLQLSFENRTDEDIKRKFI